jgi:hypothetical protein
MGRGTRAATREAERATNPTQKRRASAAKNLQNREEDDTRGEEVSVPLRFGRGRRAAKRTP